MTKPSKGAAKATARNQEATAGARTYRATLIRDGSMCAIPVPFDPTIVFGKVRAPISVTLNGYTFRSTIAAMGGPLFIPLRKSHRDAAGLDGTETLTVTLMLDAKPRTVSVPADLARALKAAPDVWKRWQALSYTHRREHVEAVENAKKAETRARRIDAAVRMVAAMPDRRKNT